MNRDEYLKSAFDDFNNGKISAEAYESILMNADLLADDGEEWDDGVLENEAEEQDLECENLDALMFRAAMEQSAKEATQEFKIAYKIQCSGKCFRHFIHDDNKDCLFFNLNEAEDFCKKESGPYNKLGITLEPVEVHIPVSAKNESKEHSTYKNIRFVSSEER